MELSHKNSRSILSAEEQVSQGFTAWTYSMELLKKMHELHPNIIVKDGDQVIGYAMVALKQAKSFHPELEVMINELDKLIYKGKPLCQYSYYVMGQICIAKEYRGKGIFELLYNKHRELLSKQYEFLITEIPTINKRSIRAHEKVGFKTIHTYNDGKNEWNAVIWDWYR
ncbi:unnamed protein product [Didymodactylos carnosus]|uniref:N-acetyltransferase domain-containing protein n=1 Tax=Didymodactylos carnosus TaxID=1234261 RepID=A0A815KVZ1_9BILA|nr:unnamed protein product [Didymodactylos carnosus]CAF1401566.1 unnamed protein product [Didymodactylos carnosus]CAF4201444.1 unnamed protein product [Didymodactylos carnosus]CAF4295251.1 unnamed protein product [Didymodactylos carnosus]